MPKISDIYRQMGIMPALQEHQLKVAAVAQHILEGLGPDGVGVKRDNVITACLMHDMGNILKFDFDHFPRLLEPQGRTYWEQIRAGVADKYGTRDEHVVTLLIAKEAGLSTDVVGLIDGMGFKKLSDADSLEQKICSYADMRVAPLGVVPIEDRLADGRERHASRESYRKEFEKLATTLRDLEVEVFAKSRISPKDITELAVSSTVAMLRDYHLS